MTSVDPLVATVVVTNYNYERYVTEAVCSALDQTVPCQVIAVDDGSTDGSPEVLRELAERHPELQVIAKSNGGQASAMNAGWAMATGDIVIFLDGDDRLRPDAVASVKKQLVTDRTAVRCQFRLQWIDGDGIEIAGGFPEANRRLPVGELRSQMTSNPDDLGWQPTSGNAFTGEVLRRIMPIPEEGYRISADHYLSNLTPLYGPVLGLEQSLGDYRVHGANQDHRADFDLARIRDILIRTDETRRHLIDHGQELGIADMPDSPDGFTSLTTAGMRLISFRLDKPGASAHPFPGDDRVGLIRAGLTAARSRTDFSPARKAMAVAWILALASVPRSMIPNVAAQALTR